MIGGLVSVRVMSWVWEHSRARPTQRLVLLAIADHANDRGVEAYPSMVTLMAKTGLSERGIRKATTELVALGELAVAYKGGPRGCNRYAVVIPDPAPDAGLAIADPARDAASDPAPDAGNPAPQGLDPAPGADDPARGAPEPSENRSITELSVGARPFAHARAMTRGIRIPEDFTVTPQMIAWARANTPLVGAKETAAFIDYWHSAPGAKGLKLDWTATWRTWMRRAQSDAERSNGVRTRPSTTDQRVAEGLALVAELEAKEIRPRKGLTS